VQVTLLPESATADELIFLRVVQSTEIIFHAAATLAARALEALAYSDALERWQPCTGSFV